MASILADPSREIPTKMVIAMCRMSEWEMSAFLMDVRDAQRRLRGDEEKGGMKREMHGDLESMGCDGEKGKGRGEEVVWCCVLMLCFVLMGLGWMYVVAC